MILVLLIRPSGLFARGGVGSGVELLRSAVGDASGAGRADRRRGAGRLAVRSPDGDLLHQRIRRRRSWSRSTFVGNSGVVSFGHRFVAVGAWAAGVLSVPVAEKAAIYTNLFPFLAETTVGNVPSLVVAALVGGTYVRRRRAADAALGTRRRHRHVRRARDHAQRASLLREDRPRDEHLSHRCPRRRISSRRRSGAVIAVLVAFAYQVSRSGYSSAREPRGCSCGPSGRHLDRPPPAVGVHPVGRSRRACRGPLRAPAAVDDGGGLPRPDVHHARDARDRRRHEPLGRGGGRTRRQRPRLFLAEAESGIGLLDLPSGSRIVVVGSSWRSCSSCGRRA